MDVVGGGEGQLGLVVAHLLGGQDTQLIKGRPETINKVINYSEPESTVVNVI